MLQYKSFILKYKWWMIFVGTLGLSANGLALTLPRISAKVVDYASMISKGVPLSEVQYQGAFITLLILATATFLVALLQMYFSTMFSEKVAYDTRMELINKVSNQSFDYIAKQTQGKLQTVITSDVNAIKGGVSRGLVTLLGAVVTLFGSAIMLLLINVKLAIITLATIPVVILIFVMIFGALSKQFNSAQENLEKLNAIVSETVIGAGLIRALSATKDEITKFMKINDETRDVGFSIVKYISLLIPAVIFVANGTVMLIIYFGGISVIGGDISVGEFTAFFLYSAMFVWPIFVLAFVGSTLTRGTVSLSRIDEILKAPIVKTTGTYSGEIKGEIIFKNVSLEYEGSNGKIIVLKNISFKINPHTKNAIIGPTGSGKTQLMYLLSGLLKPTSGEILIDGVSIYDYHPEVLRKSIGLVFQDSIMFNSSFRENILLSEKEDENFYNAIKVADLNDLVDSLPKGLDTMVSERGTSLSGGQKQRIMLARALISKPRILLLDDFTARVDKQTEASILKNIKSTYSFTTLISITQKIEPIIDYDQILVLMEGELVGASTHDELLKTSLEYLQIFESQQSTEK